MPTEPPAARGHANAKSMGQSIDDKLADASVGNVSTGIRICSCNADTHLWRVRGYGRFPKPAMKRVGEFMVDVQVQGVDMLWL